MQTDLNEQRRERLGRYLQAHFGAMAPEVLQEVCAHFSWVELEAGAVLLQQGQVADAAYLSLSGRLRVYVNGADGSQRAVRELGRGEIVGEIGLYSEAPRTATVVAVRHTVLARLDKARFYDLVQRHPQASFALTRQIIERLQTQSTSRPEAAPVMLCLLPITAHVQAATLAADLQRALAKHGRVACIGAAEARAQALQKHGAASDAACALVLDELETGHDFVLLQADVADEGWGRLCTRHADEILLLAQASEPAHIHPIEQACLIESLQLGAPNQTLLLLHPAELKSPLGMRRWLDRRPVNGHINLRPGPRARRAAAGAHPQPPSHRAGAGRRRRARAGASGHLERAATPRHRDRLRGRHLQQLPGQRDARAARRAARHRRGPEPAQRAPPDLRRNPRPLDAAARPPAPARQPPLPPALAGVVPAQRLDPLQRLAPSRIAPPVRPLPQPAAAQSRAAAVEPVRRHREPRRATRARGARPSRGHGGRAPGSKRAAAAAPISRCAGARRRAFC